MNEDRTILIHALEEAVRLDREKNPARTFISSPDSLALNKLAEAIEKCAVYKSVAGHVAYTGGSGPVLSADLLASHLFGKVDFGADRGIPAAADWLLRLLATKQADGLFKIAIWGLSIEDEITLQDSSRIMPFESLPKTYMKGRIQERAKHCYDGSVWLAHNYFDAPTAAHVIAVPGFQYIGTDGASFRRVDELQIAARDFWLFIQAAVVGHPLAIGCWFEYEDDSLDFNQWQYSLAWILPEVHPRVAKCTHATGSLIKDKLERFEAIPSKLRGRLLRSMGRFELSQCRYALVDRILELELAFEIALSGPGPDSAVSWKVSVRCAQLIGGTIERRQAIRKTINKLYRLRSKATHGSDLSASDEADLGDTLTKCTSIYQELISSLLALSKEPEWDALELEARVRATAPTAEIVER